MPANTTDLEKRLWSAADELRANSKLKSSEYSVPVLGLIFLRYADHKFAVAERELAGHGHTGRRAIGKIDYQARGVLYLPDEARFSRLIALPEGADIGKAINDAMRAIEARTKSCATSCPRPTTAWTTRTLVHPVQTFNSIPMDIGRPFGKIYEYFLGKFAMSEGQKGGEFFTPTAIVRLIVEIIEPFHGRISTRRAAPAACSCRAAVRQAPPAPTPNTEISIFGQEKVAETVRLCRMNLAVHGLDGDIDQGNTYYEDVHNCVGKFDFVMANPPFNVDQRG